MRVLAVDDDAMTRLIVQSAVEFAGHTCVLAEDGDQAWAYYQRHGADVVISDWMMPGLDGIELCERVRADASHCYTYFILATARGDLHHVLEGMQAGADDYLTKPVNLDELRARLTAAARVTALHRELVAQRAELQRLNAELAETARIDPLTQLGNRLRMQEDLELLQGRVLRYGHAYSLALIDVDQFKQYNDTHGHVAGDAVLRALAEVIRTEGRQGDGFYRYGGEEFLCIFAESSPEGAARAVQRMRVKLESLAIPHGPGSPTGVVTLSAGIAPFRSNDDEGTALSVEDVLMEADRALYRAKRLGRNRVELATGDAGLTVTRR